MNMLTTKEVAKRLRLHPYTVTRAIRDGQLKAERYGNSYRISEEALEEYKASKEVVPVVAR
jgi:excisionase family DNA binding protein